MYTSFTKGNPIGGSLMHKTAASKHVGIRHYNKVINSVES